MTIIELNFAGYRVTRTSPEFPWFKASWRRGWRGLHRKAHRCGQSIATQTT